MAARRPNMGALPRERRQAGLEGSFRLVRLFDVRSGASTASIVWRNELKITDPEFIEKYAERYPGYENYHCNEDVCQNPVKHYLEAPGRS